MKQEECKAKILQIAAQFKDLSKVFTAVGDETRQLIMLVLLESPCGGIRVGEITKRTHLSRPAVSHHLQILKESGIINMRREGTRNFYFMDSNEVQWKQIIDLMNNIYEVIAYVAPLDNRHNEDYVEENIEEE